MGDQLIMGDQLFSVVSEAGLAWSSSFTPPPHRHHTTMWKGRKTFSNASGLLFAVEF